VSPFGVNEVPPNVGAACVDDACVDDACVLDVCVDDVCVVGVGVGVGGVPFSEEAAISCTVCETGRALRTRISSSDSRWATPDMPSKICNRSSIASLVNLSRRAICSSERDAGRLARGCVGAGRRPGG